VRQDHECHGLSSRLFIGGAGAGNTRLAVAIAFRAVRSGAKAGFYNQVDLVNQLCRKRLREKAGGFPGWMP